MGQGKQVVWSVHADDLNRIHFDTRQFNHVVCQRGLGAAAESARGELDRQRYVAVFDVPEAGSDGGRAAGAGVVVGAQEDFARGVSGGEGEQSTEMLAVEGGDEEAAVPRAGGVVDEGHAAGGHGPGIGAADGEQGAGDEKAARQNGVEEDEQPAQAVGLLPGAGVGVPAVVAAGDEGVDLVVAPGAVFGGEGGAGAGVPGDDRQCAVAVFDVRAEEYLETVGT